MNFVKSSEQYSSTDLTHSLEQYHTANEPEQYHTLAGANSNSANARQGFGGPQNEHSPGTWGQPAVSARYNGPQCLLNSPQFASGNTSPRFGSPQQGYGSGQQQTFGNFQQQGFGGMQQQGFNARQRYRGPQPLFNSPSSTFRGQQSASDGPRQSFGGQSQRFSRPRPQTEAQQSSHYSSFVKPEKQEDRFEGGGVEGLMNFAVTESFTRAPQRPGLFGKSGGYVSRGRPGSRGGLGFARGGSRQENFGAVQAATAAAAQATRAAVNHNAKCIWLSNPAAFNFIRKVKRLALEVKSLRSQRPNSVDTIHSAANKALIKINCEIESGPIVRGMGTFFCLVQFDGVNVSAASALNKRAAKIDAFDIALEKIMKPFLRVVEIDNSSKELQVADTDFSSEPLKQTVVKPTSAVIADISGEGPGADGDIFQKESNVESIVDIKKRNYEAKDLSEFLLVEPEEHNSSVNGASILRRSADCSKMLLEYEFASVPGGGGPIRCIIRVEGTILADLVAGSKPAAKIRASEVAVDTLRQHCWTILTKQHHDTDAPEITKEEMFADFDFEMPLEKASSDPIPGAASMSVAIPDDNLGKKMLQKLGWSGGGIGKDGTGIEEPVSMKQVINREGLGLSAEKGVTNDIRQRITYMLESYASSERQDDLVFSPAFRKDERMLIHNECRRLNLKSKSKGQGGERFLIVRRKRSANQLLEHVMACGGETARYKVVPPGQRNHPWQRVPHVVGVGMPGPGGKNNSAGGSCHTDTKPSHLLQQPVPNQGPGLLGAAPVQSTWRPKLEPDFKPCSGAGLLGPAPNFY